MGTIGRNLSGDRLRCISEERTPPRYGEEKTNILIGTFPYGGH